MVGELLSDRTQWYPTSRKKTSEIWGTRELLRYGMRKNSYQRNPNVTGNIFTVPVPILVFELFGESTQT
jgi:hypothetical protein